MLINMRQHKNDHKGTTQSKSRRIHTIMMALILMTTLIISGVTYGGTTDSAWEENGNITVSNYSLVDKPDLFYVNGTLYATGRIELDNIDSMSYLIYLYRYSEADGWAVVGSPIQTPVDQYAFAANDTDLYIAYLEGTSSYTCTGVVKKLVQGDTWEQVGSTSFDDSRYVVHLSMDVSSGTPYVFYNINTEDKSIVKKYTKADGWQQVGDAFTNVQFLDTSVTVNNGVPYVAFAKRIGLTSECYGTVMAYSETNGWETVGTLLNGGETISSLYIKLLFYQNVPFVAYNRFDGDGYQVAVDIFKDGAWQKVDANAIIPDFYTRSIYFSNSDQGPYLAYTVQDYIDGKSVYGHFIQHYTDNGWEALDMTGISTYNLTTLIPVRTSNVTYAAYLYSNKIYIMKQPDSQSTTDHTVTFNVLSGSDVASQTVAYGSAITKPDDPTKTGFTFGGWYTDGAYKTAWDFDTDTMPDSDLTLYAKWVEIQTYTVTYDGNGNTGGDVPTDVNAYENGTDATVAGNTGSLEKTGYTFAGWNTQADGLGTDYAVGATYTVGSDNVKLYAKWTMIVDSKLQSLSVTGYALNETFASETLSYTVSHVTESTVNILPIASDSQFAKVTVNGTAVSNQTPVTVPLQNGANAIVIVVTAQDTTTKTTYTLTVDKDSDQANLASLSVVDYSISPSFDKDTTSYQVNVTTSGALLVVVIPEAGASVDVSSYNVTTSSAVQITTGSSLNAKVIKVTPPFGTTQYPFKVTAQNGVDTKTYVLSVINKDNVAALKTLVLGTETQSPSASESQVAYQLSNTTNVSVDVTPTALSERIQHITVNGTAVNNGETLNMPLAMGTNTITVIVTAEDGTTATYTISVTRISKPSNTSGTSSATGGDSTAASDTVEVIINGEVQAIGTEKTAVVDGKSTTTISVDKAALKAKLEVAIGDDQTQNTFVVPVKNTTSTAVKTQLTGDMVKAMEDASFELTVSARDIDYTLPAKEVNIRSVASALAVDEADLESIVIDITIDKLDEATSEAIITKAAAGNLEIVYPPVSFTVAATVTTTDGVQKTVTVSKFSSYVSRKIAIPAGVDPSKITTGVVYNEDGTFSHIPTKVVLENGIYYAIMNSVTNSDYSVVYHEVAVTGVEGHWAEKVVNALASRMVIENTENFMPDAAITRGDFIEYLTKGLGIYRTGSADLTRFTDMDAAHADAITIAAQYGIIAGYEDGSIRPNGEITREEAMVMITQALDAMALLQETDDAAASFDDLDAVSDWASFAVERVTAQHIMNGISANILSPKSTFTYAQAAATIDNLLVQADLINE